MTLLSVIIPALNSEGTIRSTLSSVFANNLSRNEYEVIVIDNGSRDKTIEAARTFPAEIFSCPKRGQGAARNLGLTKAKSEIICFTDADIILPKNWLTQILEFFHTHPDVDGVGGPVLAPSSGYVNALQKLEGETYAAKHYFPIKETDAMFGEKDTALYSANCAYRRKSLVSIGGFDESGLDAIDIDLSWKLILRGKRLVFNPELKVIHLGFPSSLSGILKQQVRWGKSQANLTMRYSVGTSLRKRGSYLTKLFMQVLRSKASTESLIIMFEQCAFNFGYFIAYLSPSIVFKRNLSKLKQS
jgi:cellulose synthase/poly-beta-1,6-N-acetylglucosamine synthase-like glycosyltransferase